MFQPARCHITPASGVDLRVYGVTRLLENLFVAARVSPCSQLIRHCDGQTMTWHGFWRPQAAPVVQYIMAGVLRSLNVPPITRGLTFHRNSRITQPAYARVMPISEPTVSLYGAIC